ncbi:MAG: ABC transporter substrate-binding protein [Polyangiales bacterium]
MALLTRRRALIAPGLVLGGYGLVRSVAAKRNSERPIAQRGGTLIVVSPEPTILVSAFDPTMTNCMIGSKVMEGLVTYDVDLNPRPALAERWDVSADGRTVRFQLRPGVKWHDGRDFTSADVAFSLQEVWRKLHPFGRAVYHTVEAVETPDPLTVVVHMSGPAQYLFGYLNCYGSQILPAHLYQGSDVRSHPNNVAPIGTGPFMFREWQRGSHVRLARNPHYWRSELPVLDEVIFRFIPDAASRTAAVQSGEVDLALGSAIPQISLRRFTKNNRFTINTDDGRFLSSIAMIVCNVRTGPLADRRVRQAIMHAIDREALVRLAFRGYGVPATGPVPSSVKRYYTRDVPAYPFDLQRTAALLDDAGFKPQANGTRLTLQLVFSQPETRRQADFIRQSLSKAGIQLTLKQGDTPTFLRQLFTDQAFDLALTGLHMLPDPTLGVQRLYWGKNIQKGVPWSNGSGYANPELDAIMEAAQIEGDDTRRKALIKRWQQIVQTDLPVLNLVETQWVTVSSRRLQRPTRQGDGLFDNLADAFFAT